ncbi:hypothetical protein F5883DRAFT_25060 [Diaporthe sp. PMI_573]|nr:hypothetical protein F5883DRAFT_25060 [Diaporthaceae sp. PMI_573]
MGWDDLWMMSTSAGCLAAWLPGLPAYPSPLIPTLVTILLPSLVGREHDAGLAAVCRQPKERNIVLGVLGGYYRVLQDKGDEISRALSIPCNTPIYKYIHPHSFTSPNTHARPPTQARAQARHYRNHAHATH